MKHILLSLIALVTLSLPCFADESGSCGDNLKWTFDESTKTLTISGSGAMADYEYDTTPFSSLGATTIIVEDGVTTIGEEAFSYCAELTSITIPNSVTTIGADAFYKCSGLTSVTIPNSVRSMGYGAFYGCSGLTSVSISSIESWCKITFSDFWANPLYYAKHLYLNNTEITDLEIPNTVTGINYGAFVNCSGLTSVTIPNSVTSIGERAFSDCSGLTSVTVGNSIEDVGEYAFSGCSSLTSVNISSIESWCKIAFNYFSNPLSYAHHLYLNNTEITELVIPNTVESIGRYAFAGCSHLVSVTIPESVVSIGGSSFSGCSGMTSVTIGALVKSIGGSAFYNCSGLKKIYTKAAVPPTCEKDVFRSVDKQNCILYVPDSPAMSFTRYSGEIPWNEFKNIEAINMDEDDSAHETRKKECDNNHDGVVNGADVVGIYNFIVNGK